LLEWVMPTRDGPPMSFRSWETISRDMLILSIYGRKARVRTLVAFRDLLLASGFEVSAVIPTRGSVTVIEEAGLTPDVYRERPILERPAKSF